MKQFTTSFAEFEKMNEAKKLNEYLVKGGSSVVDLLDLNVFTDLIGDGVEYLEFGQEPEWKKIVKKYLPEVKRIAAILTKNKKIKLPGDLAKEADETWYDGSDAYEDIDMAKDNLPGMYDDQLDIVNTIIAELKLK